MITINSRVKGKVTRGAIRGEGKVIALFESDYFIRQCGFDPDFWNEPYPAWKTKAVALVHFDEAQRTMTIEEWTAATEHQHGKKLNAAEASEGYEEFCPKLHQTAFPVDDLEEVLPNA